MCAVLPKTNPERHRQVLHRRRRLPCGTKLQLKTEGQGRHGLGSGARTIPLVGIAPVKGGEQFWFWELRKNPRVGFRELRPGFCPVMHSLLSHRKDFGL